MSDDGASHRAYFFYHSRHPFSQWHRSEFAVDGVRYSCCEQYMMAAKARLFGDHESLARILETDDPRTQKELGRRVSGFDNAAWERERERIVFEGNLAKFAQNATMRQALLDTGDRYLAEASPSDRIWGIGLNEKDAARRPRSEWRGLNLLGLALMRVRAALRDRDDPAGTHGSV